ncbi:hypothetical protein TPHA_0A03250 [Tetrapisispora phaffii CBS 4417]|uniref:Cyclin N-terminal domain-containing protein n=1 Tax=Tetrapisispora phaffii (strain ATCC 24235 / CBS 4417 / NBRC 1672 / NRRL Y-8282 / UCD 70-5) TaxID=1071381 RepID=G8BNC4_TETPH|nr:hypothetical protein TPHA_0A03250 [Tetrapisispora phaffii CBS 4417]CCE61402.1 hypothetical protein TPHA_0A03250 [Tetrapisispora phaffii CBS 4417]
MSDYEALLKFNKVPINKEMINYICALTESIINIKNSNSMVSIALPPPPLAKFIKNICVKSNVQTPTLMATTVLLEKLKKIIPSNVYGIESTRHRIFLGCLILSAKSLNDSSPLNKHWAKYTESYIHLREVNTIERELLNYFDWNVSISQEELFSSLSYFLEPIKQDMMMKQRQNSLLMNIPSVNSSSIQLQEDLSCINHHNNIPLEETKTSLLSYSNSDYSLPSLASFQSYTDKDHSPSSVASSLVDEDNICNNDSIEIIDEINSKYIDNITQHNKITIKRSAALHSFF